jgi:hypothetical protein
MLTAMDHLSGKSLLTRFRFTVFMSNLTQADQAQMSHEYADNPQCPVCSHYKVYAALSY